jgi:hypothetical protein
MRKTIIVLGIIFICGSFNAQTRLSPQVIASQGSTFKNGQFEISYTIGELAAVSTLTATEQILTQGFQQPDKYTIAFVEDVNSAWNVDLFPNPVNDIINLKFQTEVYAEFDAKIFDAAGRIISAFANLKCLPGSVQFPISTQGFSAGAYLIRINSKSGNIQKTLRFNKIHS